MEMLPKNRKGVLTLDEEIRNDRQEAGLWLLHYPQQLEKYQRDKETYFANHSAMGEKVRRSNHVSDPVAAKAIQSIQYDESNPSYWWLRAVELTESGLTEIDRFILYYRRKAKESQIIKPGKPAWIYSVQSELCYNYPREWYSESFIKHHWNKIVDKTLLIKYKINTKAREA